jgi:hypothetical protein
MPLPPRCGNVKLAGEFRSSYISSNQSEVKQMVANNTATELHQESETEAEARNEANKQEKIKVSLDSLKTPAASEAFNARVTCQRRS